MKKKRHLRRWVKECLLFIPLLVIIGVLVKVDSNLSKDFIKNCENAGYSYNYCVNHNQ